MVKSLLLMLMMCFVSGCGSAMFKVTSDPLQADIYYQVPGGEKKPLGKTPYEMPMAEVRKTVGDAVGAGEYFTLIVEKPGFESKTVTIPASRFGTMLTVLDVKMKQGETQKEVRNAKEIIDHIFLAQKFALSAQFERAHMELDKVLVPFPDFARALSMRASIYYAQKNFQESLKWYEEALKADPQMEDAVKMAAKVRAALGQRVPASTPQPVPAGKNP